MRGLKDTKVATKHGRDVLNGRYRQRRVYGYVRQIRNWAIIVAGKPGNAPGSLAGTQGWIEVWTVSGEFEQEVGGS
jgi:hypothetical protein